MFQYVRVRKPLLWITSILSWILSIHIFFAYLYEWAEYVWQIGWSISIGIVNNETPSLNPIEYWLDANNDIIVRFLFRSLIRYNPNTGSYEWDLANCNLSNLAKVECTLKENVLWSDGAPIKKEDIIATYKAFRESPTNRALQTFLESLTISDKDQVIRFEGKNASAQMVDILTFPIVRSSMITDIREGRFSKKDHYITSGPYTYLEDEINTEKGFERITLERNEKNGGGTYIGRYHFKFFKNPDALQKNQDTLNIIIPKGQNDIPRLPRFWKFAYHTYEYVAGFLNTDKIPQTLRSNILFHIANNPLKSLANVDAEAINNIFFTEKKMIPTPTNKNIANTIRELGYFKPGEIIGLIDTEIQSLGKTESGMKLSIPQLSFIRQPSRDSIYFASGSDTDILISGKVPKWVKAVYVNNYQLSQFTPWNENFFYRAKKEAGTLKDGKNTYTLAFSYSTGKILTQETLTIYAYQNSLESELKKKELLDEQIQKINNPEVLAKKKAELEEKKKEYQALDPRYYYTKDKKQFTLLLQYFEQGNDGNIGNIAKEIEQELLDIGIKVNIEALWKEQLAAARNGEKKYDMLIIGFDAPSRITNIIPIFHSSEAKKGINFSKIQSKKLDTLLDQFRLSTYDLKERIAVEDSLIEEIKKEAIILPIYSPNRNLYIDKNIRSAEFSKIIPNIDLIPYMLEKSFIKDELHMNFEWKWIGHFFSWIWYNLKQ